MRMPLLMKKRVLRSAESLLSSKRESVGLIVEKVCVLSEVSLNRYFCNHEKNK